MAKKPLIGDTVLYYAERVGSEIRQPMQAVVRAVHERDSERAWAYDKGWDEPNDDVTIMVTRGDGSSFIAEYVTYGPTTSSGVDRCYWAWPNG